MSEQNVQRKGDRIEALSGEIPETQIKNLTDNSEESKKKQKRNVGRLCAEGWTSFHLKCYKHITTKMTWSDANNYCKSNPPSNSVVENLVLNLASVPDEETNNFLKSLKEERAWIGGYRDKVTSNQWKWTDGTPMIYQSWASGEPKENGINMMTNFKPQNQQGRPWGQWDDQGSNVNIGFICQYHRKFQNILTLYCKTHINHHPPSLSAVVPPHCTVMYNVYLH